MGFRLPLLAPNALYRSDRLNMWLYKLINDLNHTHCLWSGGHVNLSTGWLETVYGCHAYPKKTPNTRGGDYQRRTNITNFDLPAKVFILSVALGKIVGVLGNEARMVVSLVKAGVLQSDTSYSRIIIRPFTDCRR